jgi:predicted glutamine amidotransferase
MCRMLAIVPRPGEFVKPEVVREFRKLATCGLVLGAKPGHTDGWGIVAWKGGAPFYFGREARDASTDPAFDTACRAMLSEKVSSPLIAHLRKASKGAINQNNTHPFISGEWAFAHNGTIRRLNLRSKTDSEWFFTRLVERISSSGGDVVNSIRKLVSEVQMTYPYTSLTFLLSNGKTTYAYRDCSKHDKYYTLFYCDTEDGVVICQEKILPNESWNALDNGQLMIVNASLRTRVVDILETIAANPLSLA